MTPELHNMKVRGVHLQHRHPAQLRFDVYSGLHALLSLDMNWQQCHSWLRNSSLQTPTLNF